MSSPNPPTKQRLLAIDQGTTSSRAILFDEVCRPLKAAQREIHQSFPKPGFVEHDAMEIWESVLSTTREVLEGCDQKTITSLGITNQRETIVLWDRKTGEPLAPAIVWQDRRTTLEMGLLEENAELIRKKTGLLPDPYFSGSKLKWLLRETPGALSRAKAGELAAGTIDSWLIHKLTNGREHVTDVTNASRTMLMDIHRGVWDEDLLELFEIPAKVLPRIVPTSGLLGEVDAAHFGAAIPIGSAIGDQQSALFGQLCDSPGLVKCTYGTGCFLLAFTGQEAVTSHQRLLTTIAWQIGDQPLTYALEGSVFVGGAAIQWLRDGLGLIKAAAEVNELAAKVPDAGGVVIVPAMAGMGAPYWDPSARGTIMGITRGTTAAHIARATLDGIAWQVADLVQAMGKDAGHKISTLRVDGGAAASDLLMQTQADVSGIHVERPENVESTALGAAMLAGLAAGVWGSAEELTHLRIIDRTFRPTLAPTERKVRQKMWRKAVKRSQHWI
ncbi:MAG: glycerol kinase GlpK [Terrimicrobiaceae bacterium]